MAETDYDRAGLLAGLSGEQRRIRIEVLSALSGDGVGIDAMREAIEADRLGLLLIERTLAPDDGWSMAGICEHTGQPPEVVSKWFRALGRPVSADPTEEMYTDEDAEIAER